MTSLGQQYSSTSEECITNGCSTTGLKIVRDKHLWFYFIIVAVVAIIAAIIISKGVISPRYIALNKPSWNPNPVVFGVIWSIAYIFIAYVWFVADRVSDCYGYSRTEVNILCALNIFLNIVWIYLFFGAVDISSSLTVIILLLVLTLYMIWYLYKLSTIATGLFVLYFIWLTVILFLNYNMYLKNKN